MTESRRGRSAISSGTLGRRSEAPSSSSPSMPRGARASSPEMSISMSSRLIASPVIVSISVTRDSDDEALAASLVFSRRFAPLARGFFGFFSSLDIRG